MKRLSVVILTWNEMGELWECLRSLEPCIDREKDEVLVLDNGSNDGTLAMVNRDFPKVAILRSERNVGVAAGRNIAIRACNSRFVMTLDNDTRVLGGDPGDVIETFFRERTDIGVVGFRLLNYDGSIQHSARRFPLSIQPFAARLPGFKLLPCGRRLLNSHLMKEVNWDSIARPLEVDYLIGANQIFERKLFDEVGGYDENMFYGAEDCEFCLKVRRLGRSNYYIPWVDVEHRHKRRSRKSPILFFRHLWSFYYMFFKYKRLLRLYP